MSWLMTGVWLTGKATRMYGRAGAKAQGKAAGGQGCSCKLDGVRFGQVTDDVRYGTADRVRLVRLARAARLSCWVTV